MIFFKILKNKPAGEGVLHLKHFLLEEVFFIIDFSAITLDTHNWRITFFTKYQGNVHYSIIPIMSEANYVLYTNNTIKFRKHLFIKIELYYNIEFQFRKSTKFLDPMGSNWKTPVKTIQIRFRTRYPLLSRT